MVCSVRKNRDHNITHSLRIWLPSALQKLADTAGRIREVGKENEGKTQKNVDLSGSSQRYGAFNRDTGTGLDSALFSERS